MAEGKIRHGVPVVVTTAGGERVPMVATSALKPGRDFPVIWVTTPDDFEQASKDGTEPNALPWPATDVMLATT